MLFAVASAVLASAALPAAATQAVLRELRVNNNCPLPVVLHEASSAVLASGTTTTYQAGVDLSGYRVSMMYEGPYINENLVVLELNGLFRNGLGNPGDRFNVNFIHQWGFVDMPIDVAFWKNAARTELACRDGRARCLLSAKDCANFPDGSASYEERTYAGGSYGYCRAGPGSNLSDPTACTSYYANYVNQHCEVYDRETQQWRQQARSVGYSIYGWEQGSFADGHVADSTLTGRENDGPAVTFECWEAPCISTRAQCAEKGHTTVGNSGFAVECDADESGLIDVAVLEITACASGGSVPGVSPVATTVATTAMPTTTVTTKSEGLEARRGLIRSIFGKCLDAPERSQRESRVHMWSCSAGNRNQQWEFSSGTGQIKNQFGICLAASDPSANGGAVRMRTCDTGDVQQRWVYERALGQIRAEGGICLDASQRSTNAGLVHMWECDPGNKNQQWGVAGDVPEHLQSALGVILHDNICLDAAARNTDGGTVHMWECHQGHWNQAWVYDAVSGLIMNQYGICLDAPDRSTVGSGVHMWSCSEQNENQRWTYDPQAEQIRNRAGLCLQVPASSRSNGGDLQLQACDTSDVGQRWQLQAGAQTEPLVASLLRLPTAKSAKSFKGGGAPSAEPAAGTSQRRRRRTLGSALKLVPDVE